jgi:hypothetical protein
MASQTYDVFVFVESPYTVTNPPPIANLFTATPSKFPLVVFKDMPKAELRCDTRIGKFCGKRDCTECDETLKMKTVSPDYEIFKTVLSEWTEASGRGVVIIKSTTVTTLTDPAVLADTLTEAEGLSGEDLDAFFFAKWLDRPDQFNVLSANISNGSKLVRTWNPHGLQAIAFTNKGFAKLAATYAPDKNPVVCRPFAQVINVLVQNGTLYAATTTPSLTQYDATLVSESSTIDDSSAAKFSFLKTSECRGENHPMRPYNRRISADLSLFWSVIIILVALIVAWVLLKIGAFYTTPYASTLTRIAAI